LNKPTPTSEQEWHIAQFEVPSAEGKLRFHDFNLATPLLRAIQAQGFRYCSPIQAQSLPFSLASHDVLGRAQTGTGKTAAFLVSVIEELLKNNLGSEQYAGEARTLILAPTRELVLQIAEDAKLLTQFTSLKVHTLVGGMDYGKQRTQLQRDLVDILVATPGHLIDFCESGDVFLDQVEMLVIDEADRMLDMGFIPQVRRIVRLCPKRETRQTLMFSATFSKDVLNLADQWMLEPAKVEIEPESVATSSVEQHVYLVAGDEKDTLLFNLVKQPDVESLMVFANRRDECRKLHDALKSMGIKVGLLSGEIDQNKRVKTLDAFKGGQIKVLVATDVAGRGIHINDVSHVVNYTLPEEPEDYVHRIGRTGRAGSRGTSISFACEDDAFRVPAIEMLLGHPIRCEQPPEHLLKQIPEAQQLALTHQRASEARTRRPTGNRGNSNTGGNKWRGNRR
jgi:ATP-dependent RNA helicase RhlB